MESNTLEQKKEMVITYETLFELLKREKDRIELQKLEPEFFANVLHYLREKRMFAERQENLGYEEKMRLSREMDNIRKIVKEFYDRREKKILLLSLDQSRTRANLIDFSHMLKEERDLFDELSKTLSGFREGVLNNVLSEKLPAAYTALSSHQASIAAHAPRPKQPTSQNTSSQESSEDQSAEVESQTPQEQKPTIMVRFLSAVPKFVGPDLDEFGPFSEDDIASLPREAAEVLIGKGRVEEISEN